MFFWCCLIDMRSLQKTPSELNFRYSLKTVDFNTIEVILLLEGMQYLITGVPLPTDRSSLKQLNIQMNIITLFLTPKPTGARTAKNSFSN